MKKLFLLLLAGSALTIGSCTKKGATGAQGPTGNANVIGDNKQFLVSQWTYSSTNNWYSATFADADITQDIVDNGVVEMYKEYATSTGNSWTNLPDIDGNISTVFNFSTGGFTIYVTTTDGSTPPAPGTITFRDVIISASQKQSHPHTNWNNYNDAVSALGLTTQTAVQSAAATR
jgi:hypothetical protein